MPVKASRTTTMGRVLSEKRLPTYYYSGLSNPIRQGVSVSNWGLCRISAEAFRRPRILQCPKRVALHFSPAGPIIMHAWSSNFKPFWTNSPSQFYVNERCQPGMSELKKNDPVEPLCWLTRKWPGNLVDCLFKTVWLKKCCHRWHCSKVMSTDVNAANGPKKEAQSFSDLTFLQPPPKQGIRPLTSHFHLIFSSVVSAVSAHANILRHVCPWPLFPAGQSWHPRLDIELRRANALCILDNKTTTSRLPGSRTIWSISLPSSSLPSSFLKFDVLHLKRFAGSHEAFIKAVRLGFNDRLPCNQCPAVARETLQVSTSTWTKLLGGEQKLIKVVRSGETTTWTFVTR